MSEFNKTSGGARRRRRTGVGATPRQRQRAFRFARTTTAAPPADAGGLVRRAPSVVATSTAVRLGQVVAVLPAPSVLSC